MAQGAAQDDAAQEGAGQDAGQGAAQQDAAQADWTESQWGPEDEIGGGQPDHARERRGRGPTS